MYPYENQSNSNLNRLTYSNKNQVIHDVKNDVNNAVNSQQNYRFSQQFDTNVNNKPNNNFSNQFGNGFDQKIDQDNNLVSASAKLFMLIIYIRHTANHPNVPGLKAQIIEEVKQLEQVLSYHHYSTRMIVAARYCICTAIDEAVLRSAWGTSSIWVQEGLLSLFQKETYGGERFYLILEDMLRDIKPNLNFIEFAYYLLCLGFEGRLYGPENLAKRDALKNRLFGLIRDSRSKPNRALSPNWQLKNSAKLNTDRKKKLKHWFYILAILLIISAVFYNYKTYKKAQPVIKHLDNLARVSPITVLSQVINRPIIQRNN